MAASTTVELGVPGPHDVPGASRARRNSPSPCPGTVDVVEVADDDIEVFEEGGVVLVPVVEAAVVVGVPDEVEVLEAVEEVDCIEALVGLVLVGLEMVGVPEPGPANAWP
jgi:hypothetical protein